MYKKRRVGQTHSGDQKWYDVHQLLGQDTSLTTWNDVNIQKEKDTINSSERPGEDVQISAKEDISGVLFHQYPTTQILQSDIVI